MVKSTYNTWIIFGGTFSIQIDNEGERIALLAREWATLLQCLWTCDKLKTKKCEARKWILDTICPYCANDLLPLFRTLIKILEFPFNSTLSKPNSSASSMAYLATDVSTSIAVRGRGINYDKEAMTSPLMFRIIAPRPSLPFSTKVALSKFTL